MINLHNIKIEGNYDGEQRSLEDFQLNLENMLAMSRLVGKSAEERTAASVMLEMTANTKHKTAAEVAEAVTTDPSRLSGQKLLCAVLAANTVGGAKVIVREDTTKNGAWAWAKRRERFGAASVAVNSSFSSVPFINLSSSPGVQTWLACSMFSVLMVISACLWSASYSHPEELTRIMRLRNSPPCPQCLLSL